MARTATRLNKVVLAIFCGLVVGLMAAGIHYAMMPHDRMTMLNYGVGDMIAALTAVIVCLAIQLKQEEVHYKLSMERAAIVAELNHHIRNAVFPLSLAVQKAGDADAMKIAADAVDRINIALKDATVDALSGRVDYGPDHQRDIAVSQ